MPFLGIMDKLLVGFILFFLAAPPLPAPAKEVPAVSQPAEQQVFFYEASHRNVRTFEWSEEDLVVKTPMSLAEAKKKLQQASTEAETSKKSSFQNFGSFFQYYDSADDSFHVFGFHKKGEQPFVKPAVTPPETH
jgi:hypothetical protein